ncbi:MAG: hypothetical protein ACYDGR_06465 [Candidatus Dormibacteria bacterium]
MSRDESLLLRSERVLEDWVAPAIYSAFAPLGIEAAHVLGEPITFDEAASREYRPFAVGDPWGGPWDTTWFRVRGEVPAAFAGRDVFVLLDIGYEGAPGFGGEALVWKDGVPVQGISPWHAEYPIALPARGGEVVDLRVEAAANPGNPELRPRPEPAPLLMPDYGGAPLYRLRRLELAVREPEVYALYHDFRILLGLARALNHDDPQRQRVIRALTDACNLLRLDEVGASAASARGALAEVLRQPAAVGAHVISATGHAPARGPPQMREDLQQRHRADGRVSRLPVQLLAGGPVRLDPAGLPTTL